VLQVSFFVDVALKLWKASSAGRSHAGLRRLLGTAKEL
jgi:hypothetical protein